MWGGAPLLATEDLAGLARHLVGQIQHHEGLLGALTGPALDKVHTPDLMSPTTPPMRSSITTH